MIQAPRPGSSGAKTHKKGWRRLMRDLLIFLLLAAALLLVRRFLVEPVHVKGSSMLPTLQSKEWLMVDHLSYILGEPQRGDVVICHYPNRYADPWGLIRQYFVKRIVGLPGETLEIVEGVVYINGEPIEEGYLDAEHTRLLRNTAPVTLGDDEYFVMGDNRDNSNDSRRIGPITRSMVVGRVTQVIFPVSHWRAVTGR